MQTFCNCFNDRLNCEDVIFIISEGDTEKTNWIKENYKNLYTESVIKYFLIANVSYKEILDCLTQKVKSRYPDHGYSEILSAIKMVRYCMDPKNSDKEKYLENNFYNIFQKRPNTFMYAEYQSV